MLAENLQHWAEKEREAGREEVRLEFKKWQQEVALKLIAFGSLSNEQIADVTELSLDDVKALIKNGSC